MDELRLIIRSNRDCDGITEEIIKEFRQYCNSVSGLVLDCNPEPRERDGEFEYISPVSFASHDNDIIRGASKPVDGSVLKGLLPYKDMAMHIMMRTLHYDVFDRKYLEDKYYLHVKYWNQLLDDKKINLVLFMCTPHHVGEYILYALCKVKGIRVTLLYPQLSNGGILYHLGSDIESIGANVAKDYSKLKESGLRTVELSEFMNGVVANTRCNRVIGQDEWKSKQKAARSLMYKEIGMKTVIRATGKVILNGLGIYKYNNKTFLKDQLKYIKRARRYERTMDHLKDYAKLAVKPVEGEKYIYFPLQMSPEASTMPVAGEFRHQLLSIELLSDAAKEFGLMVYVKEHWVQYNRDPGFYEKINNLDNVRLISLDCNSIDLIDGCEMVASQTGNCMFEAMLKGKPALSVGEGNTFKGAPNIISVQDRTDIIRAIEDIRAGRITIDEKDVSLYLKALEESMVYSYLDSLSETYRDYNKAESARKIVLFSLERED